MNPPEPFERNEQGELIVAGEKTEEIIYPKKTEKPEPTEVERLRKYLTEEAKKSLDPKKSFKPKPLINSEQSITTEENN